MNGRIERKLAFPEGMSKFQVIQLLQQRLSLTLVQHHPSAHLNTQYYDTDGFTYYHDSLNGSFHHIKVRSRSYILSEGSLPDSFEIKIKQGLVITKERLQLNEWEALIRANGLAKSVFVKYQRDYYWEPMCGLRVTLDSHLICGKNDSSLNPCGQVTGYLAELKYKPEMDRQFASLLPFHRFSKYLNAVTQIYF